MPVASTHDYVKDNHGYKCPLHIKLIHQSDCHMAAAAALGALQLLGNNIVALQTKSIAQYLLNMVPKQC